MYVKRLKASDINELINADTINSKLQSDSINSLLSATTVNALIDATTVNNHITDSTVNDKLSSSVVNSLVTSTTVNARLTTDGIKARGALTSELSEWFSGASQSVVIDTDFGTANIGLGRFVIFRIRKVSTEEIYTGSFFHDPAVIGQYYDHLPGLKTYPTNNSDIWINEVVVSGFVTSENRVLAVSSGYEILNIWSFN